MSASRIIRDISMVIMSLEASLEAYACVQGDSHLPKAFNLVGHRLPDLLRILQAFKTHLNSRHITITAEVCDVVESTLDSCEEKAIHLRKICEKVIPGETNELEERYKRVLQRQGKVVKVEDLMLRITRDVQVIVNNDALQSTRPEQNAELEKIIEELQCLVTSEPIHTSGTFNSHGGSQINNVQHGSGTFFNNNGTGAMFNNTSTNGAQNIVERMLVSQMTAANVSVEQMRVEQKNEDWSFSKGAGHLLGQAPSLDPSFFVGRRSEMEMIHRSLQPLPNSQQQRPLILGGPGGVGKTQLAIAYASRHNAVYDTVLWLNATSEMTLKSSFRMVAHVIFKSQDLEALTDEDLIMRVDSWLSDRNNLKWLLIFDNYDNPSDFEIKKYCPQTSHGAIIITTRQPDIINGQHIHVKPLKDVHECLEILQTRSKRPDTKSNPSARSLAERLEGFPLALATAGAFLANTTTTFERYLELYDEFWSRDSQQQPQLPEYHPKITLYTTWNVSYNHLKKANTHAAKFLQVLAYFNNHNLWHDLFRAGLTDETATWLRELVSDEISFQTMMKNLSAYCFLEFKSDEEAWSMHGCIHDWTLWVLSKDLYETYYWYALDCVQASIPEYERGSFVFEPSNARLSLHAKRLTNRRFNEIEGLLTSPQRLYGTFKIAWLLMELCQVSNAECLFVRMLRVLQNRLPENNSFMLSILGDLGCIYFSQNKLAEAEQILVRALKGKEMTRGSDHPWTLGTINNLSLVYSKQGRLEEAEQMLIRALEGKDRETEIDRTLTPCMMRSLGLNYEKWGKLKKAEQTYARALEGYTRFLGVDHPSSLITVNAMGRVYLAQARLEKAEDMFVRSLKISMKVLNLDLSPILEAMHHLAAVWVAQQHEAKASAMLSACEEILAMQSAELHADTNKLRELIESKVISGIGAIR